MRTPSSSKGFSLLELMVVLALLGFLISMVTPRLSRRSPSSEWKTITDQLNNLVQFARQESIVEQIPFRLVFSQGKNKTADYVLVEKLDTTKEVQKQVFSPVHSTYTPTRYEFAESVKLRAIFSGKRELLLESGKAPCYIVPEGLVQEIFVQLVRTENRKEECVTLKMLPFEGQFDLIEKLLKPGQEG